MTREELLARMHTEREQLWSAIAGLDADALALPGVNGEWSMKDVLAHMAFWEEHATPRLRLIAEGRAEEIHYYGSEEIDATNAQVFAERRGWTVAEAEEALRLARQRLLEDLAALTDEQLGSSPTGIPVLAWLAADTFEHDQEHLPQVLAWVQRRG